MVQSVQGESSRGSVGGGCLEEGASSFEKVRIRPKAMGQGSSGGGSSLHKPGEAGQRCRAGEHTPRSGLGRAGWVSLTLRLPSAEPGHKSPPIPIVLGPRRTHQSWASRPREGSPERFYYHSAQQNLQSGKQREAVPAVGTHHRVRVGGAVILQQARSVLQHDGFRLDTRQHFLKMGRLPRLLPCSTGSVWGRGRETSPGTSPVGPSPSQGGTGGSEQIR